MREKKILCRILAFTMFLTCMFGDVSVFATDESPTETVWGDVNGDGELTAVDAAMILQYALGQIEFTPEQRAVSKITGKNEVTVNNASMLLQKVLDNAVELIPCTETDTTTEVTSTEESTVTEESSEATTEALPDNLSWNFSSSDFSGLGAMTDVQTVSGLTLIGGSSYQVASSKNSFDGVDYTYCLKLGGGGSTVSRNISFNVEGPCTIKLVVSGGSTARFLQLSTASGILATSDEIYADLQNVTFNYAGGKDTLYIFSKSSGINIYNVTVEYTGTSPETTTETTTEETTVETTTSSSSETGTETTTEYVPSIDVNTNSKFNLTGFGSNAITGGGSVAETDATYVKVATAKEFDTALVNAAKGTVKVIEVTADLALGSKEIGSEKFSYIKAHGHQALTNDILQESGVSQITFGEKISGLTIYSKNGAKIKHSCWVFSGSSNVIIRNLEFDELWEWDEGLDPDGNGTYGGGDTEPGAYDVNDWDYITFDSGSKNMWVDHCTFNKAYDGLVDIKRASNNIVISWSVFQGDDMSENSWVTKQIQQLEADITADPASRPFYNYLRNTKGVTMEQIIMAQAPQKKAHLVGHSDTDSTMSSLSVTLYNNYYKDIQDRIPRLRGGNAHMFNLLVDSSNIYANKKVIDKISVDEPYHFGLTNQAFLSTCGGAEWGENCHLIDVVSPMSFEQKKGYPGKLLATDIWYQLGGTDYGVINSTDGVSKFTPTGKGSTMADFSWNEFDASGNRLTDYVQNGQIAYDYKYMLLDMAELDNEIKTNAGAGKTVWTDDADWLKVIYNN